MSYEHEREKLFHEWNELSYKINGLSSIVQNDVTVTESDAVEFREIAHNCWLQLSNLTQRTLTHLRSPENFKKETNFNNNQ